jgi:hypothetical protein
MSFEKKSHYQIFYLLTKSFQIVALIFFLFSLIFILNSSPSNGYELSVYTIYPIFFWLSLILSIIIGISTGAISILYREIRLFKYSIVIITLNYVIFLLLPNVRNYFLPYFGWNDALFHLGAIQNIFNTGQIDPSDVYQCFHIIISILQLFGIEKEFSYSFIPIIFYFLMSIFLLVLSKFFIKSNSFVYLIILLSLPLQTPLWQINKPAIIVLVFIILLLFFIMKIVTYPDHQKSYFFLFLVVFCFFMFSHPISTIFALFLIFFMIIGLNTVKRCNTVSSTYLYLLIGLLGIIFLFYSFSSPEISWNISKFVSVVSSDIPTSNNILENQIIYSQSAGTNYQLIIQRIIQTYGNQIIFLISMTLLLVYFIKNIKKIYSKIQLVLPILLIVGSLFFGAFLTLGLVINEPNRVLSFSLLLSPLFILVGWCSLTQEQNKKNSFVNIIFILLIIFSVILGMLNFYTSPWIGGVNEQTSFKEYQGISWFLSKHDPDIFLDTAILNFRTWPNYYYSTDNPIKINYQPDGIFSHFGYQQKKYVGEIIKSENEYYITTEIMKVSYLAIEEDRRQTVKQFLPDDYQRLNVDPTVSKIYGNEIRTNGFDIWLVKKMAL